MQEEHTELELPFTEEELKEKYKIKLEREMRCPTFQLVSKVMKTLIKRKIPVPDTSWDILVPLLFPAPSRWPLDLSTRWRGASYSSINLQFCQV